MARDTYSTYEAKARLSEILRKVREGRPVTITYHGEPVAEVRGVAKPVGLAERVRELVNRGVVVAAPEGARSPGATLAATLGAAGRSPGALERFLRDRD